VDRQIYALSTGCDFHRWPRSWRCQ